MNQINSHVQITKGIMKNFSHKVIEVTNGKPCNAYNVFYLDLSDNQIKEGNIKKLGTIKGYYSQEMEDFLSREVECKIGEIIKNAKLLYAGKITNFEMYSNDVRNFALYSALRSQYILQETNKSNPTKEILTLLGINTECSHEDILKHPEAVKDFFKEYIVTVFMNKSKIDFVIPRNCMYPMCYQKTGGTMAFIPFTPRLAFVLVHNSDATGFYENGLLTAPYSNDDNLVRNFNLQALQYEIKYNNCFIVSSKRQELEELKKHQIKKATHND